MLSLKVRIQDSLGWIFPALMVAIVIALVSGLVGYLFVIVMAFSVLVVSNVVHKLCS